MSTTTATSRANGFVTWSNLIAGLGVAVTLAMAMMVFTWDAHAAHPHKGAVTQDEMRYFDQRIGASFAELNRRLDKIDKQLERIR